MIKLKNIMETGDRLRKKHDILKQADAILETIRVGECLPLYESIEDMTHTRNNIMREAREYCAGELLNEIRQTVKFLDA